MFTHTPFLSLSPFLCHSIHINKSLFPGQLLSLPQLVDSTYEHVLVSVCVCVCAVQRVMC